MAAAVVSPPEVVLYPADGAVLVAGAAAATRVPDETVDDCLACIDDDHLLVGDRVLATVDVLADALHRAVGTAVGGTGYVRELTVLHPSHWGSVRCGVLEAAARRSGREVSLIPVALAVPAPRAGSHWAVLECAPLSTTVTVVERAAGSVVVVACGTEPETGLDDLRADPARTADIARLVGTAAAGRPLGAVHVVGADDATAAALRAALDCAPVIAVPARDIVSAGTHRRERSTPVASWLDDASAQAGPSVPATRSPSSPRTGPVVARRPRRVVSAVVAAALVAGAAGAGTWWWTDREPAVSSSSQATPPQQPTQPVQRFTVATASGELPERWHTEPSGPQRLHLVPDDVAGRRIVVTTQDVGESGLTDVAEALERLIADRGADGPFSEFDPEATFAGRDGISYVEAPDDRSRVRWHVLVEHAVQVSIGCQFREGEWAASAADCERVVRSVEVGAPPVR